LAAYAENTRTTLSKMTFVGVNYKFWFQFRLQNMWSAVTLADHR